MNDLHPDLGSRRDAIHDRVIKRGRMIRKQHRLTVIVAIILAVGIPVAAVGLTRGDDATRHVESVAPRDSVPRVIEPGTFVPIVEPPATVLGSAVATVGADGVLLFGGTDPKIGGDVGYGAAYSFASDEWTETGEWPFDRPFSPGVVAIGNNRYVVVGMACPQQADNQDEVMCGQPMRAAMFDASSGTWSTLPEPDLGRDIDEAPQAVTRGLGTANGQALFMVGANEAQVVAAFDIESQRWSTVGFPAGWVVGSGSTCVIDNTLVAAGAIPAPQALRTWELTPDRSWDGPVDHPIAASAEGVNHLICGGDTLLFAVSGPNFSFGSMDAYDASTCGWDALPPPPIKRFEPNIGAATTDGIRIVWSGATDDDIFSRAEGVQSWASSSKPFSTPVRLFAIPPRVAAHAVLVQTFTTSGSPLLGFYGIPKPGECRNSRDSACGPFRYDPPLTNAPAKMEVTFSPPRPKPGEHVEFELHVTDPDSPIFGDNFCGDGDFGDGNRTGCEADCAGFSGRYGPWTPSPGEAGDATYTLRHTYEKIDDFTAEFSTIAGLCGARPSKATASVTVHVSP